MSESNDVKDIMFINEENSSFLITKSFIQPKEKNITEENFKGLKIIKKKPSRKKILDIHMIINDNNFTFKIIGLILFVALNSLIFSFYNQYIFIIINPLKIYYNLSEISILFIFSLQFIAMILGSLSCGILTNSIKRTNLIYIGLLLTICFHILLGSVKNIYMFSISRFFISFCISLINILMSNILVEYLPLRRRSLVLNLIWFMWNLSNVFFLLIFKGFVPVNILEGDFYKTNNFFPVMLIYSIPTLIGLILYMIFLDDSHRNLLYKEDFTKSKEILERLTEIEYTEEEVKIIRSNYLLKGENKFFSPLSKYKDIFNKRILKFTLKTSFLFFLISFIFTGFSIHYITLFKKIIENNKLNFTDYKHDTIQDLIKFELIGVAIVLICGAISALDFLSKKYFRFIFLILGVSFVILGFTNYDFGFLFFMFAKSFKILLLIMLQTYVLEIFPTVIKDKAIGYVHANGYLGALLGLFVFDFTIKFSITLTIIVYFVSVILILGFLFYLPEDNHLGLDCSYFDVNGENNESFLDNSEENYSCTEDRENHQNRYKFVLQ